MSHENDTKAKPFQYCPVCKGDGYETVKAWGMDAARKCLCCKGFGLVNIREMVAYAMDAVVTLDGERI